MRSPFRKLLTGWLLATYAGIALLGHGLHMLTPDDGHHHGHIALQHEHHGDHPSHHEAGAELVADHDGFDSSIADAHSCEICEFLAHAVSERPQVVTTPDPHVFVADLPCLAQDFYSPTLVGLHAARGPPQLLG